MIALRNGVGDQYLAAAGYVFVIFFIVSVKSDRFDCKEVQCPPDVECPADSVLRVIYEPQKFDDETKNTINGGSINKIDKRTDHSRRHTKFVVEKSEELIDDHEVVKRSLQYKRRESIKIVPGDYISFVPESAAHLHPPQLNQNQHKWKRDAEGEDSTVAAPVTTTTRSPTTTTTIKTTTTPSTTLPPPPAYKPGIKECCSNKTCVCTGHCPAPRCPQADLVAHEIGSGSNIPGKCCPKHFCAPEPKCTNTTTTEFFWPNKCKKCKCVGEHRLCHDACEEDVQDRQCFSPTQQRPFLSGVTWQEDECTMCECKDGDMKCQTSFCRPLDCPKQVKLPGDCCKVCVAQEPTTTQTTITDFVETTKPTTEATEPTTTTVAATTTTTPEPTTTTPTTTTITTTSPAPTTTTIQTTTTPPPTTPTPIVPTQQPNTTTQAPVVITPRIIPTVQQVPQTAQPPPECITPTLSTTKATMFLPAEHFKFLETSAETIILYVVIVILLVICCIFVGLYVHELTKRTTYSSIPSSDSNLSQMPRPKTESA